MLLPEALPTLHAALDALSDRVDGWLLFDFRGINPIMAAVVGEEVVGSRRAYVFIPRGGDPVALVHAVDAELWRGWPPVWRRIVWVRREELSRELAALVGGKTVAMEYSPAKAIRRSQPRRRARSRSPRRSWSPATARSGRPRISPATCGPRRS